MIVRLAYIKLELKHLNYFIYSQWCHLNSNDQNIENNGNFLYNNGNNHNNDNNNNRKNNLEYLLNCANKIYSNPISQRDLIRKDNNGKIGVYA